MLYKIAAQQLLLATLRRIAASYMLRMHSSQ
jgi:hypothetical protein